MAAAGSKARKQWTAIVLTCESKTNAHIYQKGSLYNIVYSCFIFSWCKPSNVGVTCRRVRHDGVNNTFFLARLHILMVFNSHYSITLLRRGIEIWRFRGSNLSLNAYHRSDMCLLMNFESFWYLVFPRRLQHGQSVLFCETQSSGVRAYVWALLSGNAWRILRHVPLEVLDGSCAVKPVWMRSEKLG